MTDEARFDDDADRNVSGSNGDADPSGNADTGGGEDDGAAARTSVGKVILRIAIIAGVLAVSGYVLLTVFNDLDWNEVGDAIRSLDALEIGALAALWLVWIVSQGWQTASLIAGLSPLRAPDSGRPLR